MSDLARCDFCKKGRTTRRYKPFSFCQWSDKGNIVCLVEVPVGICDRCGSQHWNEAAETIVEEAFQEGYRRKSLN